MTLRPRRLSAARRAAVAASRAASATARRTGVNPEGPARADHICSGGLSAGLSEVGGPPPGLPARSSACDPP
eukprot:scaffold1081_cov112-Isochrysis_galbana.AAC.3